MVSRSWDSGLCNIGLHTPTSTQHGAHPGYIGLGSPGFGPLGAPGYGTPGHQGYSTLGHGTVGSYKKVYWNSGIFHEF